MATHSNRSPSPLSSCPRNSDTNFAPRRSFSGSNTAAAKPWVQTNPRRFDPFTPANSPSDFGRGRSDEKENDEKDQTLKFSKVQSSLKSSKNFMAPTISAASKFTPSPRKKVLVERNDPVRTSISLSDGKAMFLGRSSTEELETKLEKNESKPSKRVTFVDIPSDSQPESVITDHSLNVEAISMENEISCSSKSPSADPSLPPYDPKTNYLSPRPQFLHYKPNPRIGILLNNDSDMLESDLMSENFSDSEEAEEVDEEELPVDVAGGVFADMVIGVGEEIATEEEELPVDVAADMVIGVEDEIGEGPELAEPLLPVSSRDEINEEALVEEKRKKPWGIKRVLCFSMVLMFIVACVSITITHSPAFDEFNFKDLSISDVSNFYHQSVSASARMKFDTVMRRVNELSVECMSFVSNIAKGIGGKREEVGTLRFMNLSDLISQENPWNRKEEMIVEDDLGVEDESIAIEEEEEVVFEEEFVTEENDDEEDSKANFDEEVNETQQVVEAETSETTNMEEEVVETIPLPVEVIDGTTETANVNNESPVEAAVAKVVDGTTKTANIDIADREPASLATMMMTTTIREDKFLVYCAMGASSLIAALFAILVYHYKKTRALVPSVVQVEDHHPLLFGKEKQYSSQKWQEDEDVEGNESSSWPSEMSSFGSKKEEKVETESTKMRGGRRRESLASSSSEYTHSPSYGSFTTYERIPIKHGEDEVITPVRRSSRIRSHQPRE